MARTPRWRGSSCHPPESRRALRRAHALVSFLFCLAALALSRRAEAASRVVVLEPAGATDSTLVEATARLRGELGAAGFEVVSVVLAAERPPLDALGEEAARAGAFAAVLVLRKGSGAAVDLMVVDRATQKTVVRTVEATAAPGDGAAAEVALRAVELLQASLLEATHPPPAARALPAPLPRALPADVAGWVAPRPTAQAGPTLGAGVAMLQAFGGIGPQIAPVLRLGYGSQLGWGARLTVAGPTAGPVRDVERGEASVRQELALLELVLARELGRSGWVPSASLGAGALHLAAIGLLDAPTQGRSDDAWAFLAGAGVGLAYRIDPRWSVCADSHLLVTEPAPLVLAGSERVGRAGRPSLLVTLGVAVRLGED
jgi:hypothetical protein